MISRHPGSIAVPWVVIVRVARRILRGAVVSLTVVLIEERTNTVGPEWIALARQSGMARARRQPQGDRHGRQSRNTAHADFLSVDCGGVDTRLGLCQTGFVGVTIGFPNLKVAHCQSSQPWYTTRQIMTDRALGRLGRRGEPLDITTAPVNRELHHSGVCPIVPFRRGSSVDRPPHERLARTPSFVKRWFLVQRHG